MKIILLSTILLMSLYTTNAYAQSRTLDEAAETVINNNIQLARVLNRNINFYRDAQYNNSRAAGRLINNELELTKQANSSMRMARERLKNKRLIRKAEIEVDIDNPNCTKEYNSYIQHACYAYNDPKQPQDSVLLKQYEITVLLNKKKKFYKVCLNGEEYYVLRNQE